MTDLPDKHLAREVRDDNREVRADGREGRADARDGRQDVREGSASKRDDRADEREENAVGREKRAVGRAGDADRREGMLIRLVRIVIWMTAVLAILTTVAVFRSFVVQDAVEHVEEQQTVTGKISADTLAEMRAALRESQGGPNSDAIRKALEAIARMEHEMCGGPCPDVPPE